LPEAAAEGHPRRMPRRRHCEVCGENIAKGSAFIDCGERLVFLCKLHQRAAKLAGANTAAALNELFKESDGRRTLLSRRANERRLFPPRPEGRRQHDGRRSSDQPSNDRTG
jgi:hypothetical protein